MLGAMRTLALDYLFQELDGEYPPDNLDSWYQDLRANYPEKMFRFLVEDTGDTEWVFVIKKSGDSGVAELYVREMTPEIAPYLPFLKLPPRAAQAGPVFKRSYTKVKRAGPLPITLNTTMEYFRKLAKSDKPWSPYFVEILSVLESPQIKLMDGSLMDWKESGYESLLECVVQEIGEWKGKTLVAVEDSMGNLPGNRREYCEYLLKEKLAGSRYLMKKVNAKDGSNCPLCGTINTTVFPNALSGAGLNLVNMDREGAFPGIDLSQAWKGYALCVPCADLFYVYKYHVLKKTGPKKDIIPFTARIAGESALIIPFSTMNAKIRQNLLRKVDKFIRNIPTDVEADEETLLDILKDEKGIINLTFLWADIGQNLENVTGVLTDVPPTRLRELCQLNENSKSWKHSLFPELPLVSGRFDLRADLSLKALYPLFHRPGGKKAQNANNSKRLFQLKRAIAAAVYHKRHIPSQRFWDEVLETARWRWLDTIENGDVYGLLNEGKGKKGPYLTVAGWVRHLAWWLHYFKQLEVLNMENDFYVPELEELKPYLGKQSGIDSKSKAFAFLLGVVYGRLLFAQSEAKVGLSALKWVKRFTIGGKDFPELYKKILAKILEYRQHGDEKVVKLLKTKKLNQVIEELSSIGNKLGDNIELSSTLACYYLLLGQSLSNKILKT